MAKNILITGMTSTGKSTAAQILVKEKGFLRIVTYTTRKPRPYEVPGKDYHFLTNKEFLEKVKEEFFAEYTEYDSSNGHIYYGSSVESYKQDGEKILVVNSDGLKALKSSPVKDDFVSVCLLCDEQNLRKRLTERGDSIEEQDKRIASDKEFFKDIEKYADILIDTSDKTPQEVAEEILERC